MTALKLNSSAASSPAAWILCLLLLGLSIPSATASPCDRHEPPFSYQFAPLERLIADADRVVFASVVSFETGVDDDGLDGTYILNVMDTYTGNDWSPVEVRGFEPYDGPPQYYFGSTEAHSRVNPLAVQSFRQILLEQDGSCIAAPKLTLGYTYIVFEGLNAFVAYEPIHTPTDAWAIAVGNASGLPY